MRWSRTFLSGWLPGSLTTVPARVAVFGGEPASRAWIRARRISTQKARTRRRFMTRIKVKGTMVETRLAESSLDAGDAARRVSTRGSWHHASSIQEIRSVQGISLRGPEACIAYDAAQFVFGCAIIYPGRTDYILFQHHGTNVVSAEAQAHLADFQALRNPTRLHIEEV